MIIKALYHGKEIEVEIDDGTMYRVYCEQEHRFHVSDVLERISEYFEDNDIDKEAADEYIEKLRDDKETLNSIIEKYKNYEGKDDAYFGRRINLDEAMRDIRSDIEDEFDIEIFV